MSLLLLLQREYADRDNKESINEVLVQGKDGKWYDAKFDKNGKKNITSRSFPNTNSY